MKVAGVALLKSLSAVNILLRILQEFRNFFVKSASERLLKQPVPISMLWLYISKYRSVFSP